MTSKPIVLTVEGELRIRLFLKGCIRCSRADNYFSLNVSDVVLARDTPKSDSVTYDEILHFAQNDKQINSPNGISDTVINIKK